MEPSLTADFWVSAYVRRCRDAGVPAYVMRRGEASAGAVLIRLNGLDGRSVILDRARRLDGTLVWIHAMGPGPRADADCDGYVERALARDPDLWIIEVEDRERRHFLDDPVEESL